jgi:hypothetical protein
METHMDSPNKIKILIGDYHLETEGSEAAIEKRLSIFKELVQIASKAGITASEHTARRSQESKDHAGKQSEKPTQGDLSSPLRKLYKADGRIVTLEMTPQGGNREGDAFLLLLLGHKILRGEELVPVGELLEGVKRSGFSSIKRMDEITAKLTADFWNKVGERRAGKFRLTVPGDRKARELAQELIGQMG